MTKHAYTGSVRLRDVWVHKRVGSLEKTLVPLDQFPYVLALQHQNQRIFDEYVQSKGCIRCKDPGSNTWSQLQKLTRKIAHHFDLQKGDHIHVWKASACKTSSGKVRVGSGKHRTSILRHLYGPDVKYHVKNGIVVGVTLHGKNIH